MTFFIRKRLSGRKISTAPCRIICALTGENMILKYARSSTFVHFPRVSPVITSNSTAICCESHTTRRQSTLFMNITDRGVSRKGFLSLQKAQNHKRLLLFGIVKSSRSPLYGSRSGLVKSSVQSPINTVPGVDWAVL